MKNMSDKTKKLLVIGCLAVVCVVLIAAIVSRFQTKPAKDGPILPSTTVSNEITLSPDTAKPNETTEKKDEIVVKPTELGTPQGGTSSQNANEVVQSNVPEPVKPTPPAQPTPQGDVTNPSKPPEYKPEDTTVSKSPEPKAGGKKDGKVYMPGFGWIKDEGGGVQQNNVGSNGDVDKQVGTMN